MPSIFLYRRIEDGEHVDDVIDGKQRIESIFRFIGIIYGKRFSTKSQLPDQEQPGLIDWSIIKGNEL